MFSFPFLLTIYAGFAHAFEADHLLAVSNIVSKRNKIKLAVKDGLYWGLGHTSIIIFIGILIIVFKAAIAIQYFKYLEAIVGIMLIVLAVSRFVQFFGRKKIIIHAHSSENTVKQHKHLPLKADKENKQAHSHSLAYGVGLVHGLAGSGALVVIAMSQMKGSNNGFAYLLIFGVASIAGMMLAAGLFSIPFSKEIMKAKALQSFLIITSSLLCLVYGSKIIYENLIP